MIESGRSLIQFVIGFLLFILPITFISSFKSTAMSFILVLFGILVIYVIYKFSYFDAIFGIFLACLIGGSVFYFRVNQVQIFSVKDYKNLTMKKSEK